jgi:hypothetical protein
MSDWNGDHGERLARVEEGVKALSLNLEAGLVALDRKMDKGFDAMIQRQDRTNGTVAELSRWRWLVAGGLGVLTFLLGAGVGTTAVVLIVAELARG